jgi:hypothetical protein
MCFQYILCNLLGSLKSSIHTVCFKNNKILFISSFQYVTFSPTAEFSFVGSSAFVFSEFSVSSVLLFSLNFHKGEIHSKVETFVLSLDNTFLLFLFLISFSSLLLVCPFCTNSVVQFVQSSLSFLAKLVWQFSLFSSSIFSSLFIRKFIIFSLFTLKCFLAGFQASTVSINQILSKSFIALSCGLLDKKVSSSI